MLETFKRIDSFRFLKEVRKFPIDKYDLIISDFEPVTCWSSYLRNKKCFGLSNQSATLHPLAPSPKTIDPLGKLILEYYAPVSIGYGFHFKPLSEKIYTPVIRKQVRDLVVTDQGHYTIYLPSYDDEQIIKHLKKFGNVKWEVFSKHNKHPVNLKNITIRPVTGKTFLDSMAASSGVLCNAGFGTASEALFLGKKLLVVPMKTQYEQHCNAAMLKSMGVSVMKSLKSKHHEILDYWIVGGKSVSVDYPDQTEKIVDSLLNQI